MEEGEWKQWQLRRLHTNGLSKLGISLLLHVLCFEVAKPAISAVEHKIPCDRQMDGWTELMA